MFPQIYANIIKELRRNTSKSSWIAVTWTKSQPIKYWKDGFGRRGRDWLVVALSFEAPQAHSRQLLKLVVVTLLSSQLPEPADLVGTVLRLVKMITATARKLPLRAAVRQFAQTTRVSTLSPRLPCHDAISCVNDGFNGFT
jgi:hypothetical protein